MPFALLKDYVDRYNGKILGSLQLGPRAGDLMRSMQLLQYVPEDAALEVRARDHRVNWMTAVAALDADTFLGAENSYNLFALRKNSEAAADEDRSRLEARLRPYSKPRLNQLSMPVCGYKRGAHTWWKYFQVCRKFCT